MIVKLLLAIAAAAFCGWLNKEAGKGIQISTSIKSTRTIYRKIMMGVVTAGACFLLGLNWLLAILIIPLNFVVFSLPLTLFGSDINDHWFNRPWLFVLGLIIGSIILLASGFGLNGLIGMSLYGMTYGILQLLSLKREGLAEFLYGSILTFLAALMVAIK